MYEESQPLSATNAPATSFVLPTAGHLLEAKFQRDVVCFSKVFIWASLEISDFVNMSARGKMTESWTQGSFWRSFRATFQTPEPQISNSVANTYSMGLEECEIRFWSVRIAATGFEGPLIFSTSLIAFLVAWLLGYNSNLTTKLIRQQCLMYLDSR